MTRRERPALVCQPPERGLEACSRTARPVGLVDIETPRAPWHLERWPLFVIRRSARERVMAVRRVAHRVESTVGTAVNDTVERERKREPEPQAHAFRSGRRGAALRPARSGRASRSRPHRLWLILHPHHHLRARTAAGPAPCHLRRQALRQGLRQTSSRRDPPLGEALFECRPDPDHLGSSARRPRDLESDRAFRQLVVPHGTVRHASPRCSNGGLLAH